jgi:TolB protein
MRKSAAFFIFFLILYLCHFRFAYAKVYIDIDSPSFKKFPIAVTHFGNLGEAVDREGISKEIYEVLTQDLEVSGLFNLIDPSYLLKTPEDSESGSKDRINFRDWSLIGAEALIKGNFFCNGQIIEIEAKLYDIFRGHFVMGKRYVGKRKDIRRIIHRFTDEVLFSFTGERGVFDTKIAFVSDRLGNNEIYTMDFDGYNATKITDHKSIVLSPSWSTKGKRIAFTSYKRGNPDIYIKDLATSRESRISHHKGLNIAPAWSPDGERLAVTLSKDGNPEIYVIDKHGNELKRLTNHWGIDVSAAWSPDGKKIAFVSDRSGKRNIYIMDSQGDKVRRLTFEVNYSDSPDWSLKEERIVFSSLNDGYFDIYTVNSDGYNLKRLTSNSGNNEDPSWSPDGRYIAFTSTRDKNRSIYIMRADGSGLRRLEAFDGDQFNISWSPRFW